MATRSTTPISSETAILPSADTKPTLEPPRAETREPCPRARRRTATRTPPRSPSLDSVPAVCLACRWTTATRTRLRSPSLDSVPTTPTQREVMVEMPRSTATRTLPQFPWRERLPASTRPPMDGRTVDRSDTGISRARDRTVVRPTVVVVTQVSIVLRLSIRAWCLSSRVRDRASVNICYRGQSVVRWGVHDGMRLMRNESMISGALRTRKGWRSLVLRRWFHGHHGAPDSIRFQCG